MPDLPLRQRNPLIMAAGYAPIYRDEPLEDAAMQDVQRAVSRLVCQHESFPALGLDRYWSETTRRRPSSAVWWIWTLGPSHGTFGA